MSTTKQLKALIVGAVAGGASAATRLRRLNEAARIVLFEKTAYPSFANCGMPYYLGGEISSRAALIVTGVETLQKRYAIDVRIKTEVVAIDRANKLVKCREQLSDGDFREYTESYDKLVLATGAKPFIPPIPGIDLPGIYSLRSLDDVDAIYNEVMNKGNPTEKECVIVGGGFIGVETVENMRHRGVKSSVVELLDQVMPNMDREMVTPLHKELAKNGVNMYLREKCEKIIRGEDGKLRVCLASGKHIPADFVIMAVGVRPDSKLAADCGLGLSARGGITVNENMQTSDPDIYAVGDVAETVDYITKAKTWVPLAGPANRQGRIAADHICGRSEAFRGVQGTSICKAFNVTVASTGQSEKALKRSGHASYRKIYCPANSHASYYPGAQRMIIKLMFDPEDGGRILGAQIVGSTEGVDKRIDVIATAIQARMTVYDLEEMELAYSPQFGSAKDPINMIGFIAAGSMRGDQRIAQIDDVLKGFNSDTDFLLDVRTEREFACGSLPNAVNIPLEELRNRISEIPKDKAIYAFCRVGMRGYMAQKVLQAHGFEGVQNLTGGYECYSTLFASTDLCNKVTC